MHDVARRPAWLRSLFLVTTGLIFACSDTGGDGCGGCGGAGEGAPPYEFAGTVEEHVVLQGGQVHVSQRGLDFLAGNLGTLAGDLIGGGEGGSGGIPICVPPTDVALGIGICNGGQRCDDGSDGCQLEIEFACRLCDTSSDCPASATCDGGVCVTTGSDSCVPSIDLSPQPGDPSDRLTATINLALDETIRTTSAIEDCNLNLRSEPGGFPVAANVYFDVGGPPHERVSARLPAEELSFDIDNLDISLTDGFLCGVGDFVLPLVTGLLDDFITQPISDAIEPLLCTACDEATPCPAGSSCQDGVCRYDGADECVPLALGIETEINIGDLLADIAPGSDARLGLLIYLANYADSMGPRTADLDYYGLDLALEAGFYAERDECVPFVAPPDTSRVPKSREINADLTPSGEPFAIGIGFSKSALDLAGWAAYNSGTLCLSVGTDFVSQISTGTFGLLIPSLGDLADGENREMYLQLRPQQPPTFDLGLGTVTAEGDIDDPLLTLRLDNLELDFYAVVADRFVRVMTLSVDVAVPLGLDVNENNEIVVLLGDLGSAFTRVEASNADLLAEEDVAQISELLPGLIGALLPALGGDLIPPIALPDLQGITIRVPSGGFTSVEDRTMLAIFADLAIADAAAKAEDALQPMLGGTTLQWSMPVDELLASRERGDVLTADVLTPTVELALDVPNASADGFEWSYRLDDGLWSTWRGGEHRELRDARFILDGAYELEVRVREPGRTDLVSPEMARTIVHIDRQPPRLALAPEGPLTRVEIDDVSDVVLRARIGDGPWRVVDGVQIDAPAHQRLEVEAVDEAGHRTTLIREARQASVAPSASLPGTSAAEPAVSEPRAGCAAAGGTSGGAAWLLLALGALLWRGRRPAIVAAAATLLLVAGCGSKDSTSEACDPVCESGFTCEEGACVPDGEGCTEDGDCAEGQICNEGVCEDPGCTEDADCGEGQVCNDGVCEDAGCTEDADCPEGQVCDEGVCAAPLECAPEDCECADGEVASCVDNECVCEPACGGGCDEGEGCCYDTQECVEIDIECEAADCGPGFEVAPLGDPAWDPATCEATIECDCQELPPLALGEVGELLDLGVSPDGTVTAVATYNAEYGDLMVGLVDGTTVAWSFVDGVPADGDIRGSVNGPRGGIRSDGDDIGRYASLEVDAAGGIHVAYYARNGDSPRSLKYAYGAPDGGGYTWSTMVLDPNDDAGWYTDVVLDDAGLPIIGYVVPLLETDGAYASEIRIMAASASPPASPDDFGAPEVLARVELTSPCADSCTSRERCRDDNNTCARPAGDDDCEGGCADGEACFENEDASFVCSTFLSPSPIDALPTMAGAFLDIEWLGEGRIGAAWYSSDGGDLHYLEGAVGALADAEIVLVDGATIDDGGERTDTSDAGRFPDLFVDSAGERWIAYADATFAELRIAAIDGGTVVTVDSGFRCWERDPEDDARCLLPISSRVGDDAQIAEVDGSLSVVFQDATMLEVWESPRVGSAWDIGASIAGNGAPAPGALGFYLAHGVDDEGRFVLTQRYDVRSETPARDVIVIRR